jgi:hypothetical protein
MLVARTSGEEEARTIMLNFIHSEETDRVVVGWILSFLDYTLRKSDFASVLTIMQLSSPTLRRSPAYAHFMHHIFPIHSVHALWPAPFKADAPHPTHPPHPSPAVVWLPYARTLEFHLLRLQLALTLQESVPSSQRLIEGFATTTTTHHTAAAATVVVVRRPLFVHVDSGRGFLQKQLADVFEASAFLDPVDHVGIVAEGTFERTNTFARAGASYVSRVDELDVAGRDTVVVVVASAASDTVARCAALARHTAAVRGCIAVGADTAGAFAMFAAFRDVWRGETAGEDVVTFMVKKTAQ